MPDGPHRIDWEWEEIVLACDLVAQNHWRQLDASDPRVRELSDLLQRMSIHPLEARLPSFRNAAGVARKTNNIATVHPNYVGPPSNGKKLDKRVLDDFLDDYEQMHRFAQSLRRAAEEDEPGNASYSHRWQAAHRPDGPLWNRTVHRPMTRLGYVLRSGAARSQQEIAKTEPAGALGGAAWKTFAKQVNAGG